jgi:hypothetical protein
MPTIPFNQVVNIKPGVLSAAGNAVDLNAVVLTQSTYAPQNQVLDFSTAAAVAAWFGATSTEAAVAATYFSGPNNATATPGLLKFLAYAETAVAGFLLGGSLATLSLSQMQALSGTLILTVGGTLFTSSTITLSAATSFSDAATIIQAAFTSPTFSVTFDSVHQAFLITTSTTGSTETITYCTGTLASGLALDSASGGTLSQGAAATTPNTALDWLIANDQNWASFFTAWSSLEPEQELFAAWASANAPRYAYISWDTATADATPNNPASFGGYLLANQTNGVLPIYGTQQHAAFAASWAASLNFNQQNGRSTLAFRSQGGLAPSVTDGTTYAAVISNGYNVYAAFGSNNPANNANWMTPGLVSGQWKWADTYFDQMWLNANLQLAVATGLQSVGQVPYNSTGDALIAGWCRGPITQAVNFGAIRAGVQLSAAQIQAVTNLVGGDVSSTLYAKGWYLFSNAAGTASSVRVARGSPPVTLLYVDGESVQSITMPSIVIQ